jgi:PKD repeat protein
MGGLVIDDMGSAGPFSITARNVSIGGHLANSYGVYVATNTVGETATVNLTDSVIHGPTTALHRSAVAGATANLTTSYDAYPAGNYAGTGSGTTTELTPPVTADPGFPASGDFRVGAGSPLIDAGTPGPLAPGESTTDPDGNPRLLDGNHDCVARRDIGAYEFNDPTPTATASASVNRVATGARVTFHGSGCSNDPNVPVTFGWAFDDGTTASGADVAHAFAQAGTHHATLTVRDASGHSSTAGASVTVFAPSTPPTPSLSKLGLKPSRFHVTQHRHKHFKLGTTISYIDSRAATTTFTVTQNARGVVTGKRCVAPPRHPSKRGKKPKQCTRTVTFGTFTHRDKAGANSVVWTGKLNRRALKPGSYTLSAVASASGRKSRTVATGLTVLA